MPLEPSVYRARWRVRIYELDANGHVNNAVYLNYAEQVATEHAEAGGFGRAWTAAQGGAWVVHQHQVTYHRPAFFGDELEISTRIGSIRGARGTRETSIVRLADGATIVDVTTEWVWVRLADGRPTRVPAALTTLGPTGTA